LIGTMAAMEWTLELVLVVLLGATLLQAIRLERALGVLKRDRGALESLVVDFNASTHQAESGIQRLRGAVDVAGRQIESQVNKSVSLKDELAFITERGDRLADRLDTLVRVARPLIQERPAQDRPAGERPSGLGGDKQAAATPKGATQAERDLLQAVRLAR
jgi:hypothetical protein